MFSILDFIIDLIIFLITLIGLFFVGFYLLLPERLGEVAHPFEIIPNFDEISVGSTFLITMKNQEIVLIFNRGDSNINAISWEKIGFSEFEKMACNATGCLVSFRAIGDDFWECVEKIKGIVKLSRSGKIFIAISNISEISSCINDKNFIVFDSKILYTEKDILFMIKEEPIVCLVSKGTNRVILKKVSENNAVVIW